MPDTDKDQNKKSEMTVQEAGHLGGQRERELVEEGHQHEQKQGHQDSEFGEKVEQHGTKHKETD